MNWSFTFHPLIILRSTIGHQRFVATAKFFGVELEIGKVTWRKTASGTNDDNNNKDILQKFTVSIATFTIFENVENACKSFIPINFSRPIAITVYKIPFYIASVNFQGEPHMHLHKHKFYDLPYFPSI